MPLYDYTCPDGHTHEFVRPLGTEAVACATCRQEATRSRVHRIDVVGPTVDTRGMYRRFTEATSEMDHAATRVEQTTGRAVASPPLWQVAKSRAKEMQRRGEARLPA